MSMLAHIFRTWALAQLLHPLLLLIALVFPDTAGLDFWIGGIFFIFIFSVFASIPSLFMAWLLFYILSNAELTPGEKLIGWLASVVAAILVNFMLLSFLFDGVLAEEGYRILPPATIAGVLSILIRLKAFFQFQSYYKMNSEKIN